MFSRSSRAASASVPSRRVTKALGVTSALLSPSSSACAGFAQMPVLHGVPLVMAPMV